MCWLAMIAVMTTPFISNSLSIQPVNKSQGFLFVCVTGPVWGHSKFVTHKTENYKYVIYACSIWWRLGQILDI